MCMHVCVHVCVRACVRERESVHMCFYLSIDLLVLFILEVILSLYLSCSYFYQTEEQDT